MITWLWSHLFFVWFTLLNHTCSHFLSHWCITRGFLLYSLHVENTNTKKNSFSWVRTFLLHLTVSLSQRSYKESFPARYTLRDKLFSWKINEISDMQFNTTIKLKYANLVERNLVLRCCLMAWWGPDLFVYTSSSVAFFLMHWEESTVIFPTHFICVWLRTSSTVS